MPNGKWEKCYAKRPKSDGNMFTCYKKKGHHITGGRDNRKHVDNKQAPAVYWEGDSCGVAGCPEPPDPMNERNQDAIQYCEDHWGDVLAEQAELARKGIY